MVNQTKYYEVENIKAFLQEAKATALIDYQGLSAEQVRELRQEIRAGGGRMMVAKNTLITLALKQMKIKLPKPLTGPTALVIAVDEETAPLQVIAKTKKEFEKPEFKLGIYQEKILSSAELEKLAALPPKEVLLTQLAFGLANPLQRLAFALQYNQNKLLLALKAVAGKKEVN